MIAIDWGTSSFRAYRLDAAGAIRDERHAAAGLLDCRGRFESVLAEQVAGWNAPDDATIVMAGMVGSRNGWREVPYVECPAGPDEIARGMLGIDAPSLAGRRVWIAPGVVHRPGDAPPEVMRGEETQIAGILDALPGDGPHTLCLPGTHSKWVRVERGRIVGFRTAMTGELYALVRRHSLLAALMPPLEPEAADAPDETDAFARGVAAAERDGGLANHLFGVRTLGLFGALAGAEAPAYLSGLLIGHELRGLLGDARPPVHLVGNAALVRRYGQALALRGIATHCHGEAATAMGLFRLAGRRG